MRITIKDLARDAGVSPATVSYVINNGPRAVHPTTRERVLESIRRLDYHPSAVARGLSNKRMNTLGIITLYWDVPEVNLYFAGVLNGILAVAQRRQQSINLFPEYTWAEAVRNLATHCDGRCDGILLFAPPTDIPLVSILGKKNLPFVLVSDHSEEPEVSGVDIDNAGAACALVTYLVEQGHQRIAILGGDANMTSAQQRRQGYRQALEAADIGYDAALDLPGTYNSASGYRSTMALLERSAEAQPTALFCSNDDIAFGALRALQERGRRVPQEMSVVGFDDLPPASMTQPPLTTVRQPLRELGERAAEMLLAQIAGVAPSGQKEVLPTELIVRASVAPLR